MGEPPVDIRPDHLSVVWEALRDALLADAQVWVFGSRAKWTAKESSDLDLAIDAGRPLTRKEASRLDSLFDESTLPYRVDVIDPHRVSESFLAVITRDRVPLPRDHATRVASTVGVPGGAGRWRERPLAELTENFDGIRVPVREADRRTGPYPYYGASGVVDHVDSYLFDGEYLLIAEDGENLRTRNTPVAFLARGRFWVNNHAHIVRGNGEADTRFLMYALSAMDIGGYLTGSTMPKLTQGNLNRISLRTPPLAEQRAIAHVLGTLDDKIELNRRMSETLEALARALFKSWFIDFDPVRAKTEGREPGIPAPLADIFPSSFEDSELGEIPSGWRFGRLADVVTHIRDTVDPGATPDRLFRHFSIPAFDLGHEAAINAGSQIKSHKTDVPPGAVLLSKLNPGIDRVWLVDANSDDHAVCSTEFLVLMPRPPFSRSHAYCLARSAAFRLSLEGLVTGTSKSHQRAPVASIMNLPAVLPPDRIVESFAQTSEPLLALSLARRAESVALAGLRDVLLPRLISGEFRTDDPERFLGGLS